MIAFVIYYILYSSCVVVYCTCIKLLSVICMCKDPAKSENMLLLLLYIGVDIAKISVAISCDIIWSRDHPMKECRGGRT